MTRKNKYRKTDVGQKISALRYLFFCVAVWGLSDTFAQNPSVNWEELRAAEKGKSPFVSRVFEYKPAPGQFINEPFFGTPEAAETMVGDLGPGVSLGGFGGYIVIGFDHTVLNDPDNPYGIDFTVVGNAAANSTEPGIVMVMADTNDNGLPDDTWYELKGSSYDSVSTVHNYTITYTNPKSDKAADVPWSDNQGAGGFIKEMSGYAHPQPYYPMPDFFPDYPQDEVSFTGSLIRVNVNDDNPSYIRITPLPFGYADNLPYRGGTRPPFLPDDPKTFDVIEGHGGNAFDIDWAVDENGNPVYLEGIDFIKIYTAVNVSSGWLGEISTEVRGIIDVSPDDVTSVPAPKIECDISVYPNPANEYLTIRSNNGSSITRAEIWNTTGKLVYVNANVDVDALTIPVSDYPEGIYLVRITEGKREVVKKISVIGH